MHESTALAPSSPGNSSPGARALRVLHVVSPAKVGGLERVVCSLARGQRDVGIDVRIAAVLDDDPGVGGHPVIEELRASGIAVDVISIPPRSYRRERRQISEICRRWAPDVFHTHGYRTSLVDSAVGREHGIPRISTFHGFTGGDLRNRVYEWLERRNARDLEGVVAVSRALGERLVASGIAPERLHVIANAHEPRADFLERLEARAALALPHDGFILGWIGRLTKEKGADVLIDAVARAQGDRIAASVIGDGAERRSLATQANAKAAQVSFHGAMPDAARYLRAFDVFVLSSRTEGTPMVVFEAMEAGIPIIATRVGGVPDVLRPQDALLVAPNDAGALAAAIQSVAGDPDAARARATSARSRLNADYSVRPWVERYTAAYRQASRSATL
ncbi:MAG TPA: glycosyltransferase [Gemmatimonadaceae bacterium]|nr:glycosyltransferase [Gemmatimonadaceae bacterium]